jgi:predicted nucleic acid-binding protein
MIIWKRNATVGSDATQSLAEGPSRIALDTSVFIYQLQANPKYLGLTDEIFAWLQRPKSQGVTSTLTMTELLVGPYRDRNQQKADEIYGLLSTFPNLAWIPPSLEIADAAARLRARHGLRTPDALVAATAIHTGATGLITNDVTFRRISELQILVLDDLLQSPGRAK